jgi:hypothetical protein
MDNKYFWLLCGGAAVIYFAGTKKGTEQLVGMLASAVISTAVHVISPNQRQLG